MKTPAPLKTGDRVWFLKSMRRAKVVGWHLDGLYTIEVIENGKQMIATREGLCLDAELSTILEQDVPAIPV